MAPNIYLQLYVLRAHVDDGAVSCVYAFLAGKMSVDYQNMLQAVARQCVQPGIVMNPSHLMIDFELVVHNAFRGQLGVNAEIHGCFFHLCQGTWRQIQSLGLVQTYQNDLPVKKCVGMMDGLAFLPVNQVHLGVVAVQAQMTNTNPALLPLLAYFMQYYVATWAPNQNNIMVFQPPRSCADFSSPDSSYQTTFRHGWCLCVCTQTHTLSHTSTQTSANTQTHGEIYPQTHRHTHREIHTHTQAHTHKHT